MTTGHRFVAGGLALAVALVAPSALAEVCDKMAVPTSTGVAMSVAWRLLVGTAVGTLALLRPRLALVALGLLGAFVGLSAWIEQADADLIAYALAEGCGEPIVAAMKRIRIANGGMIAIATLGLLGGWWRRRGWRPAVA